MDHLDMLASLIFIVCFIIMLHLLIYNDFDKRLMYTRNEDRKKECHSQKSGTKQAMDEKVKIASSHVAPHTERNSSGRNWEIFKDVINSTTNDANTGKKNVRKKSSLSRQRSKKKVPSPPPCTEEIKQMQLNDSQEFDESKKKVTKQVAMDCEMVGIGDGTESMIARVSIVNRYGFCLYDKYVKAREEVQDYRTSVSGIRPHHLQNGEKFEVVQKEVAEILRGRILVGHALKYDLNVLYLSHPRKHLRDTSRFKVFQQLFKGRTPSLKKLTHELLGREIQIGEHSSVEDARAAMQLYMLYRNKWEATIYSKK